MSRSVYSSIVCASWVIAASAGIVAQTPQVPVPLDQLPPLDRPATYSGPSLSLNDAIDEALRMNPALIALRGESDAARQRPAQAGFLSAPVLSAQVWQWPINTLNPMNTNMYMFTIEQEFPGRGKRDLRAAAAQKDADLAVNDVALGARQTLTDLKHAYATLLVARKAVEVYGENATVLRQLADVSEAKYAAGRITQHDVLKPVAELSRLYDDALMVRGQAGLASARLNALMGRPIDAPIGPLQDEPPRAEPPPVDALVQLAIDHQPGLQAARLGIEKGHAELAVARSDAKPDFTVQGGYMLTPRGTDAWTGQFGITWPSAPWLRGKVDARIAETTAAVRVAEARLHAEENAVRLAIHEASIRLKTAEQRATLLQTTIVPQSRQTLEVSRIGYETDRVDFLTLLENQRTLLAEELEYVRSLGDAVEARADLERAVGIDLDVSATVKGGR